MPLVKDVKSVIYALNIPISFFRFSIDVGQVHGVCFQSGRGRGEVPNGHVLKAWSSFVLRNSKKRTCGVRAQDITRLLFLLGPFQNSYFIAFDLTKVEDAYLCFSICCLPPRFPGLGNNKNSTNPKKIYQFH